METRETLNSYPAKLLQLLHQLCTSFDTFLFIPREGECLQNKIKNDMGVQELVFIYTLLITGVFIMKNPFAGQQ